MGQGPQLREPEETTVALDRVDGPKDARQPLGIAGLDLERQEIPVELVQVLGRFDQKLADELAVVAHHCQPGVHRTAQLNQARFRPPPRPARTNYTP